MELQEKSKRIVIQGEDYAQIPALVHPAGDVLAAGFAGVDCLSLRVAASAALSRRRHYRGGSFRAAKSHSLTARPCTARPQPCLKALSSFQFRVWKPKSPKKIRIKSGLLVTL